MTSHKDRIRKYQKCFYANIMKKNLWMNVVDKHCSGTTPHTSTKSLVKFDGMCYYF